MLEKKPKLSILLLSITTILVILIVTFFISSNQSVFRTSVTKNSWLAAISQINGMDVPGEPTDLELIYKGDGILQVVWAEPQDRGQPEHFQNIINYSFSGEKREIFLDAGITDFNLENLENGDYSFIIYAENENGRSENDKTTEITIGGNYEEAPFTVSDVEVVVKNNSALLEWGTNKSSSYVITYAAYNSKESGKTFTSMVVGTEHTYEIFDLSACSRYWFYVTTGPEISTPAASQGSESYFPPNEVSTQQQDKTGVFQTSGCKGESMILSSASDTLGEGKSAYLQTNGGLRRIFVSAPNNLKSGTTQATVIQATRLEKEKVKEEIKKPLGKIWAGDQAYSIRAFDEDVKDISGEFNKSVTVSINYLDVDIEGLNPDSLTIYHYEDISGWAPLVNCSNYPLFGGGYVTCSTTSFSIFGLFGEEVEEPSSGVGSSSGSISGSGGVSATEPTPTPSSASSSKSVNQNIKAKVEQKPVMINAENNTKTSFTKDLWHGLTDAEVKILQKSLNKLGYGLGQNGAGSLGNETTYFGPLTKSALIKFQEANREKVLKPYGLINGTGFFGPMSRNLILQLLGM